jgi:hypothetical protein
MLWFRILFDTTLVRIVLVAEMVSLLLGILLNYRHRLRLFNSRRLSLSSGASRGRLLRLISLIRGRHSVDPACPIFHMTYSNTHKPDSVITIGESVKHMSMWF